MRLHTSALARSIIVGLGSLTCVLCSRVPEAATQNQPAATSQAEPLYTRTQNRTYVFPDTQEKIPYALFVSSKVQKDQPAPLIVALHGLGAGPTSLFRSDSLRLAEEGGYILVCPMGYNTSGWYGIPLTGRTPAISPAATPPGTPVTDPVRIRELSEKDVLNVLDLMKKEFKVDPCRTYLMGHSLGGAGALFLGSKHAATWAAVVAIAPADPGLSRDRLTAYKDTPLLIQQGDADTSISVDSTRHIAEQFKALNLPCTYKEYPSATHGTVLTMGMQDVFDFFAKNTKPAATTLK